MAEGHEPARIADAHLALIAHRSWLAGHVRDIDGWLVRHDPSPSRRTNSVLPLGEPADLAMGIGLVEALHRQRSSPPCFQIMPSTLPAGLDAELADRGYEIAGAATAMVAQTEDVIARAGERTRTVHVAGSPDVDHLALWAAVDGYADADRPALAAVARRTPAVYASMRRNGRVWSVARGTLVEDWCGLNGLATDPAARGHGLATDLVAEIARRALAAGARGMWLQVERDNPAVGLYERLGFAEQYAYHYRRRG